MTDEPLTGELAGRTVAAVVADDLCIGCGLCEAVTGGRVTMALNDDGALRPSPVDGFKAAEEAAIMTACPAVVAEARPDPSAGSDRATAQQLDPIWGYHRSMVMAWSAEPEVRFRAATGGVLTALGRHLIDSGRASFVLHVAADPEAPTRNRWVISETVEEVLAHTGSRYSPTAPLAGLRLALDRAEPFAIIAKPCDLGAVHRYAAVDARIDEWCVARLAMVCGGQSRHTKTIELFDRFGVPETEVDLVRYRGHGNPGPARVETGAGVGHEISYQELWADESTWAVDTRCKFCPDALGEAADVAAADAWPGGSPTGEDDGFNAVIIRTIAGQELVDEAVAFGRLTLGEPLTADQLNDFQPHQVRKKEALAARYEAMTEAGVPPIHTIGLRIDELGRRLAPEAHRLQHEGTLKRLNRRD